MRPDQTEGIDDARRKNMNKEPIYPLDYKTGETVMSGEDGPVDVVRSVNQRLAPIFRALLDDADGWEYEWEKENAWIPARLPNIPVTHVGCDRFRLAPKHKMMTVTIPVPDCVDRIQIGGAGYEGYIVCIPYRGHQQANTALEAIRKAMEGKS